MVGDEAGVQIFKSQKDMMKPSVMYQVPKGSSIARIYREVIARQGRQVLTRVRVDIRTPHGPMQMTLGEFFIPPSRIKRTTTQVLFWS